MEKLSAMDEDYDLWLLFRNTNDTLVRARVKELRQVGVRGRLSMLLLAIQMIENKGGAATPSEIARWLVREPHTISDNLNKMEKEGLVKRVKDLKRKNLVRAIITKKGEEYYKKTVKRESIRRILSCLSVKERQQLRSYLEKLRKERLRELAIEQRLPWGY